MEEDEEPYGIDRNHDHPRALDLAPEEFFWNCGEELYSFSWEIFRDGFCGDSFFLPAASLGTRLAEPFLHRGATSWHQATY